MAIRLTGLVSNMDTESIIQEMVAAKRTKVDDAKKDQTKLEWKQDVWKGLNSKLKSLQSKHLNIMRYESGYSKKTTTVSNSSAVSVITGADAVNGVQELKVKQLAKSGFLTGGRIASQSGEELTALSKLSDLTGELTGAGSLSFKMGDQTVDLSVNPDTTISDVLNQLKSAGVNANFDAKQQRIYVTSKESGEAGDFTIEAGDENGAKALAALGLKIETDADGNPVEGSATKIKGQDAVIELNGARYTGNNNVFEINGLTFTALETTAAGQSVTVTTKEDTEGIYDMIKSFLTDYNEIVNTIDKLYNADSAKGYEPLTSEEKEAMSEDDIEKWETKVKDSLLRRDSNLSNIGSWFKKIMSASYEVDGEEMSLLSFGIETLGYFNAEENERNAYHIDGDPDDENTLSNEDKLKSMIANDPDKVVSFFSKLSNTLYMKMNDLSSSVEGYRSFGNFYDDKKMKTDYSGYKTKISDLEDKLTAYEDKWYSKFSAMETALARLQSNSSAVTSLLGG